jgi:WXG100 family type VII secretion target
MVNEVKYRFPQMEAAANEVDGYAERYNSAAVQLEGAVLAAIASWEGESRVKFDTLFHTGDQSVHQHTHIAIPNLVRVISAQIRMARENMQNTDQNVASNIPSGISVG